MVIICKIFGFVIVFAILVFVQDVEIVFDFCDGIECVQKHFGVRKRRSVTSPDVFLGNVERVLREDDADNVDPIGPSDVDNFE